MKKIFSLIITIFTVAASFAQYPNQINLPTQYVKLNVLTNLGVPNDTFSIPSTVRKYPHIAVKGTNLYCWDTTLLKWSAITSGGSSGLSQVVAQYGLVQVNDSTFKVDTLLITTRAQLQNKIDSIGSIVSGKLNASDSTIYYPYASNPKGYKTTFGTLQNITDNGNVATNSITLNGTSSNSLFLDKQGGVQLVDNNGSGEGFNFTRNGFTQPAGAQLVYTPLLGSGAFIATDTNSAQAYYGAKRIRNNAGHFLVLPNGSGTDTIALLADIRLGGGNGTTVVRDTLSNVTGDVTFSGLTSSIGAGKVTNTMLAGSIAASKLVGTDIATVGTITSGTWHGTPIDTTYTNAVSKVVASAPITVTAIGKGDSLSMHVADGSHNGYLSSSDWTTFNSKLSSVDTSNISNFYLKVRSLSSLNFTTAGTSGASTGSYNSSTGVFSINVPNYTNGSYSWSGGMIGSAYSATSATIDGTALVWTFTGSSPATFTLPDKVTSGNRAWYIKNIGSADLTVARAGSDQIWTTTSVTSITIHPGQSATLTSASNGLGTATWEVLFDGYNPSYLTSVDTSNISNFYLKVRSELSAGTGIGYNSSTGVISNTGVTSVNGNTGAITIDTNYISNFYQKVRSEFTAGSNITISNGVISATGGAGGTQGIDSVLAVGQSLSADRTIDQNNHKLTFANLSKINIGNILPDSLSHKFLLNVSSRRNLAVGNAWNWPGTYGSREDDSSFYNWINVRDTIATTNTSTTSQQGIYPWATLLARREVVFTNNNIKQERMQAFVAKRNFVLDGIDSVLTAPSGSDFNNTSESIFDIINQGTSHRAVIQSSTAAISSYDATNVQLNTLNIHTKSGSLTHLRGAWAGTTSYVLAAQTDSIDNWAGFYSTDFLFGSSRIKNYINFLSRNNPTGHIDSLWFLKQLPGTGTSSSWSYIDGNLAIGNSNFTPAEKLEVTGHIKMIDGNQSNGYIMTTDANGKGSWTNPTSLSLDTSNISNFYTKVRSLSSVSFSTTGNSGAATGSYNNATGVFTFNIPQYLSSADRTTLDSIFHHSSYLRNSLASGDSLFEKINDSTGLFRRLAVKSSDGSSYANTGSNDSLLVLNAPLASSSHSGEISATSYKLLFVRQIVSNPTGTWTLDASAGGQVTATLTATGGRTLAFTNLTDGNIIYIKFLNQSGSSVALTLPSNSFVDNVAASTYTIPADTSDFALTQYDGTHYYFSTTTSTGTGGGVTSLNGNTGALTMDTSYISNFYTKVRSEISATSPITYNNATGAVGINQSSYTTDGYLSAADYKRWDSIKTVTISTSTWNIDLSEGRQRKVNMTATGYVKMNFTNIRKGDVVIFNLNNTSGSTKVDSLPANSYVDYASAATYTIPTGISSLTMYQYDGTNYYFSSNSTSGTGSGLGDPGGNGIVVRTALNTTTNRTLTGTTNEITITNGDGTGGNPTVGLASTLALAGKTVTVGDANYTIQDNTDATKKLQWQLSGITTGTTRTITIPDASTTMVGTDATQTLTNKRVTLRTGSTTSSATPTINTDNVDMYLLTAQAVDITSMTTNLSGTPTEGQKLIISITGTASRAITWGSSFEASSIALPTTTSGTSRLDCTFIWNTSTSKWRITGYY